MSWILTISEREHSSAGRPPLALTFEAREKAKHFLSEYVLRRWDQEMDGAPSPDSLDDMIDEYFALGRESYSILQTVPVQ
jgi:hypothetical protein